MIKAYKLYTGKEGHSHVQEGYVDTSFLTAVKSLHFKETAPQAVYDWHQAPTTQYVLTLKGTLEFTTSLGETFTVREGDVLIATDVTGKGHRWKLLGDDPWHRAYIIFERNEALNFHPKENE
ncbi:hypothetical protein GCM10023231_07060 [Olivibacter ginsenosidimutans]|uniref:Cupin domain-containing protein n=1 Tax=Olivibacter ginsenosidimutans TaxID=1176537 RepID=A0ABP9AKC2_9SPHI